jgi:hypothetical protein
VLAGAEKRARATNPSPAARRHPRVRR